MLETIRNKRAIDIEYQSMNKTRPEPEWRRISPHALAHDGLRWHVRAYCHLDHKFKDFILSRCLSVGAQHEQGAHAEEDRLWQEILEVKLVPNERLSKAQRTIISNDYEMVSGTVVIPVRKALLYYFEKRLRLDVADLIDQAHEAPVVVSNRVAFNAALKEATS
jgi:predicted DNA-binding transcriptional regulator YafY